MDPIEVSIAKLERIALGLVEDKRILLHAVQDALEYFSDRADVYDGDYGQPVANSEARVANALKDAMARTARMRT
jgi:hypothetical protein